MPAFTIARFAAAGMLFVALGNLPYSYYTLMRFMVCIVGGYGAFVASERKQQAWMWAFGVTALLFNPFVPVHLDRATWAVLDLTAGVLFLVSVSNRALLGETTGVSPSGTVNSERSAKSSPVITESETLDHGESSAQIEAAALRETERNRRAEEHERFRKWQERVYKK